MTDESTPDPTEPTDPTEAPESGNPVDTDTPPPPPPPPIGDPTPTRLLRRSRSDRVIAGVAGGVGNYFGVDPVIVRIAFLVLALFGGSGVMLYLVGWLVIAKEGRDESRALQSLRGSPEGNRGGLFMILVIVGLLIITSPLIWWPGFGFGGGLALPLLLIAAGVALFVWPADGLDFPGRRHDDHHEQWRTARSEIGEARRETREAWRETRREWRHGYRRGFEGDATTPAPPPPAPPAPPTPEPGPKAFLGPLTLALLLLFTGGAVFAHRIDWIDLDPAIFLGIILAVIGVMLVLSAFLGRARGLIVLGVMILPIAWAVNAIDLTWWDGVGEETHTIDNLSDLEDEYRYGIGEFIIDLSDLDLEGESRDLAVGLTIGEATVYVPEGMHVNVDLDGRIGELRVDEGSTDLRDEGFDLAITTKIGEPEGGTLNLDFDLGIGSGRVVVCSLDSATPGVQRCP